MKLQDVLAAALHPVLYIIQESTQKEYEHAILPSLRYVSLYLSLSTVRVYSSIIGRIRKDIDFRYQPRNTYYNVFHGMNI